MGPSETEASVGQRTPSLRQNSRMEKDLHHSIAFILLRDWLPSFDLQSAGIFVTAVSFLETGDNWILFLVQSTNLHLFIVLRIFTLNVIEKDWLIPVTLLVVFLGDWIIIHYFAPITSVLHMMNFFLTFFSLSVPSNLSLPVLSWLQAFSFTAG